MRHRIGGWNTGLGNPSSAQLNNNVKLKKEMKLMLKEAVDFYFKDWDGCDYQIEKNEITIGIEPSYQYDRLKIIRIATIKENSYIKTGRAWGSYGSEIASTIKYYNEYKYKSKFVKFIDKWHKTIKWKT